MESFPGPEHCDWHSATFLYVELDLDQPGTKAERQQYLDPEDVLSAENIPPSSPRIPLNHAGTQRPLGRQLLCPWAGERGPDAVGHLI